MTRFSLTFALALVLVAPVAEAAKKPDLRAVRVQASTYAHPGGQLPVRVTATASRRRTRAKKVRIYLSSDRKRSKRDLALRSRGRLPALKPRRRASTSVRLTLPASVAPGSRYVIGCAGNMCRPARTRLTITASADESKTSAALIEADLRAGRISPEKALTYRVFAVFGDERLPARYAGDVTDAEDDAVMREASNAWLGLSRRAKRSIARYFAPPPLRERMLRRASAAAPGDENDPCKTDRFKNDDWQSVPAAGGKVRLNWLKERPGDGKVAREIASDVSTAYARFAQIMGREPLSDADVPCWHGKDGALDIYFVDLLRAAAITVPSAMSEYTTPDCDGMASFILSNAKSENFTTRFVLAHELFHAFQNAFPYQDGCRDYKWFDEASANWAAHAAFPGDDGEHRFRETIEKPGEQLHERDYDSWPFPLWMDKSFGEGSIRSTYEAFGAKKSLPALDQAIGGFRKRYLDFAKHGWNQEPVASFRGWDNFDPVPLGAATQHLFLAGQRSRTAYVPTAIPELARDYKPFTITDEKIEEVVFRNPLARDPDARVGAILTLKSGATRFEDWSGKQRVAFCRDKAGQDIASMVIVFANSSIGEHQVTDTAELGLRDTCDGLPWRFKVLNASLDTHADGGMPGSGQHLCGMVAGMPIGGQTNFKASTAEPYFSAENQVAAEATGQLRGQISVRAPATFSFNVKGCKLLTDPVQTCSTAFERTPTPDGHWDIGFTFEAASRNAANGKLTWWIQDPSVGFFDATDAVCNVFEIWHPLETAQQQQEIPLDQLAGTDPVTLTFHGNGQWTQDSLGRPAHLAYDWTYKMTIQRVDQNGQPL